MQNSLVLLMLIVLSSCSFQNDSFEEAKAKHRGSSLTEVSAMGEGLPFYKKSTLNPTWDEDGIVKISDLKFRDQDNREVSAHLLEGKRSIFAFIFTSCVGYCPLIVRKLQLLEKDLGNADDLQIVAFTVDPEVDTPEVLKSYAKTHNLSDRWTLLTGRKDKIYQFARENFASETRQIESDNMRKFAHTEHFYMIDGEKRLRAILNGTRKDLAQDAKGILSSLKI